MANKKAKAAKTPLPFSDSVRPTRDDAPPGWSQDSEAVWLFPLELFGSDIATIDLALSKIRRLTQEDVDAMRATQPALTIGYGGLFTELYDMDSDGPGLEGTVAKPPKSVPWWDFTTRDMPWVVEIRTPPDEYQVASWIARLNARNAECAMRIVDGRYPFLLTPAVFQLGVEGSLSNEWTLRKREVSDVPDDIKFRLTSANAAQLSQVHFGQITTQDDRIRIALSRFHRAGQRETDDALIDLWIGLEALFSESAADISYKVAIRIPYFVERDAAERVRLSEALRGSYKARSDLVHGRHHSSLNPERRVAREALRRTLSTVLSIGAPPKFDAVDAVVAFGGWLQ